MTRTVRLLLLALAVAAAAVAVNLVLLGSLGGGSDPVGKLRPIAPGLTSTLPARTRPAAPTTDEHRRKGREEDD